MTGLRLMNEIMDPADARADVLAEHIFSDVPAETAQARSRWSFRSGESRSPKVRDGYSDSARALPGPQASATVPHLAEVWSYINPFMLYGRHLGFKGNFEKLLAERDPKALELFHSIEEVKQRSGRVS